jgi:predicted glycoside hydrolase/deacetylase ChbG (UPF0249 family)
LSAPAFSVVVPAFDEADGLAANLERLVAVLARGTRSFEVILVDDGSADETHAVATAVAAAEPRIRVHQLARNAGKGRAIEAGCAVARGDILVLLDADLQIPPEEVLPLVEMVMGEQADLVVGSKYLGGAPLRWPLGRRILSRLYQAVTAVLFRLPLRDTQTGLKAMRRAVAEEVVPHLCSKRFAWDLEFVYLAVEAGYRCKAAPVGVEPATRASRLGWRGAVEAGLDTVRIFLRARAFGGYAVAPRGQPRNTRLLLSGDDLGLAPGVDAGLIRALSEGGLRSCSVLAEGATQPGSADALRRGAPDADVGVHIDLYGPGSLAGFLLRTLLPTAGVRRTVQRRVREQLCGVRALGLEPTHVDAHRHAWLWPWVRRAVLESAQQGGVHAARSLQPRGSLWRAGPVEGAKRLLMLVAATCSAGERRRHPALAIPDGHVDVGEVRSWLARRRVPGWARGRTLEMIAHPASDLRDLPPREQGTLDRAADLRDLVDPPLIPALHALGIDVVDFRALRAPPFQPRSI